MTAKPQECMPCTVKKIGEELGLHPFDWWEYPDRVVIVFQEGAKMTFERRVEAEPEPVPVPAPKQKKPRKTKK